VVGEEVDAHAERFHPAELRCIGKLAMLDREAMVRARIAHQRPFHAIEHELHGLVAIGVDMHLHAGCQRKFQGLAELLGRHIPLTIRRAVEVARPRDARRKALYRAIEDELDLQAQALAAHAAQLGGACDKTGRREALQPAQRDRRTGKSSSPVT
jgi:hypothetical protein